MKKKRILFGILVFTLCFFTSILNANASFNSNSLKGFKLKDKDKEYAIGEKVYVELDLNKNYEFSESSQIVLYMKKEVESGVTNTFAIGVNDILSEAPYITVSPQFEQGETYYISKIFMVDNINGRSWFFSDKNEQAPEGTTADYFESLKEEKIKVKLKNKVIDFSLTSGEEAKMKEGEMTFNLVTAKKPNNVKITLQNKNVKMYHQTVPLIIGDDNVATLDMTQVREPYVIPGNYYISKLYLEPDNPDESVTYNLCNDGMCGTDGMDIMMMKSINIKLDGELNVSLPQSDEEANAILQDILLLDKSGTINSKINIYIKSKLTLLQATLTFTNETGSITVNVKDLDTEKPYFIIPFTSEPGTYSLDYAILKASNGKEYQYRKGEAYYNIQHFDFTSVLYVSEGIKEGELFTLENDKIDELVIKKIKKLDSNIAIEIDANNNSIISADLFEAIKGANKTIILKYRDVEWTFNGLDITNSKQIDVSTSMNSIGEEVSAQAKAGYQGIVINFADNNKLPGKCLIKIYNSELIQQVLNEQNANIYYMNEETGKYDIIKLGAEYSTKGFYEFYIDHNSKYFLTTETVEEKYIGEDLTGKFNPVASITHTQLLQYSIIAATIFLIMIIIIARQSNAKRKIQQKQQSQE